MIQITSHNFPACGIFNISLRRSFPILDWILDSSWNSILGGFSIGFITGSNTGFPIGFNIGSNIGSNTGRWVGCLSGLVDIWSHGQEVIKSMILGSVPSTSGAIARKSLNRASWDRFRRHLGPWPGSHKIEHPGIGSVDIWGHGQEVIKSSILGLEGSGFGGFRVWRV